MPDLANTADVRIENPQFTVVEGARILGVSKSLIHRDMRMGLLVPYGRVNRRDPKGAVLNISDLVITSARRALSAQNVPLDCWQPAIDRLHSKILHDAGNRITAENRPFFDVPQFKQRLFQTTFEFLEFQVFLIAFVGWSDATRTELVWELEWIHHSRLGVIMQGLADRNHLGMTASVFVNVRAHYDWILDRIRTQST